MGARSFFGFAFLAVVACSEPAPATESELQDVSGEPVGTPDWIDPNGRIGVTFVDRGWIQRSDRRPTSLLEIVPSADADDGTYCALWESRQLPPGGTQAQANAAMDRHTRETAVSASIASDDLEFWRATVNGISTVDMRFHDATSYQRWRMFMLVTPQGGAQVNFVCGAKLPVTEEKEAVLDEIVMSLQVLEERQ